MIAAGKELKEVLLDQKQQIGQIIEGQAKLLSNLNLVLQLRPSLHGNQNQAEKTNHRHSTKTLINFANFFQHENLSPTHPGHRNNRFLKTMLEVSPAISQY